MGNLRTPFKVILLCFFFLTPLLSQPSMAGEEVKEVALDFDDVDIRLFIRVISELTEKNFIVDNKVRGKVTVLSPKKLTTEQAYEVFKSVLAVNGFAVVEAGEVTKIVVAQHMSGYGLPLSTRKIIKEDDQFLTQIMPLKYLDAKGLLPVIKPLLSRQGAIFAPLSSDLLILTDYKSNIRKINKLLDEIDIEMTDQIVEKLDLKYSSATIISSKITTILEAKYSKDKKGTRAILFKVVPLERINAVVAVASPDVMTQIRSVLSQIDHPTPEGKGLLNVYYLENADAEAMVRILTGTQKALTGAGGTMYPETAKKTEAGGVVVGGKAKALGKDVTITADKSTNSLIIYAKPDDYNAIKEMIKMLDIPRKQVFIETLIMEVSPTELFEFGTEWSVFRDVGHPIGEDSRVGVGAASKDGALDALLRGDNLQSLGSGLSLLAAGQSVTLGGFTFPSLTVLIRAAESLSTVNILSRPQLLTLNNETATINISTNLPFETTETILEGGGTSQNIEYRDVGIILEITPHINKAGKVRLEISQEVSKLTGAVTADRPVTLKRAIDTVVEVIDGGMVIIGGLIEQQRDFSRSQTPCLGGLPLIGWAFKTVGTEDTKTNLLVFISPRVIETAEGAAELSIDKKEFIENERNRQRQKEEDEKPFFMEKESEFKDKKRE